VMHSSGPFFLKPSQLGMDKSQGEISHDDTTVDELRSILSSVEGDLQKTKHSLSAEIARREEAEARVKEEKEKCNKLLRETRAPAKEQLIKPQQELAKERERANNAQATLETIQQALKKEKKESIEIKATLQSVLEKNAQEGIAAKAAQNQLEKEAEALKEEKKQLEEKLKLEEERWKLEKDELTQAAETWKEEKKQLEAKLRKNEEVFRGSLEFANWLLSVSSAPSPQRSFPAPKKESSAGLSIGSIAVPPTPKWVVSSPLTVGVAFLTDNVDKEHFTNALNQALNHLSEKRIEVRSEESLSGEERNLLVLLVTLSGGPRHPFPEKVKNSVTELRKHFANVGVCIIRYGDKEDTILRDCPRDPTFHPVTSAGGEHLTFFLQWFKNTLFAPSQVNDKGIHLLLNALSRIENA